MDPKNPLLNNSNSHRGTATASATAAYGGSMYDGQPIGSPQQVSFSNLHPRKYDAFTPAQMAVGPSPFEQKRFFHQNMFDSPFAPVGQTSGSSLNPLYPNMNNNLPIFGVNDFHYRGPLPTAYQMPFASQYCAMPPPQSEESGRVRNL